MSCAPSWKSKDDFQYNMFLFTIGFFLPLFVLVSTPRVICLALELAYLSSWYKWMTFLTFLYLASLAMNAKYLIRHPKETLCGVLCNLFAPCILIEDKSSFLKISTLSAIQSKYLKTIRFIKNLTFNAKNMHDRPPPHVLVAHLVPENK